MISLNKLKTTFPCWPVVKLLITNYFDRHFNRYMGLLSSGAGNKLFYFNSPTYRHFHTVCYTYHLHNSLNTRGLFFSLFQSMGQQSEPRSSITKVYTYIQQAKLKHTFIQIHAKYVAYKMHKKTYECKFIRQEPEV